MSLGKRWLRLIALCFPLLQTNAFSPSTSHTQTKISTQISAENADFRQTTDANTSWNVQVNEFFKKPVPLAVLEYFALRKVNNVEESVLGKLTSPPGEPGVPRPLWLVILGSVPSGLLWYGYYKFAVEEELLEMEIRGGKTPKGLGGYGTLGPFVYGCLLGPLAYVLHLPGGMNWSNLGIVFIYYTQFVLYDRVNELYREEGLEEPLSLWWTLPIFFPFDLIVGLRQVHYLSQYWYRKRNMEAPVDPVVDFFPFIGAPRFTWVEFVLTPALWCKLFSNVDDIDPNTLPEPVQQFLALGQTNQSTAKV
ncbi:hypothetical protein FisN_4Lh361 [Fistulifera solaris]|uniref:Uncharacterized protein n=1 Tax=Fistulifera solaris TaxID=1519565 RepID=A0A1Z5JZU0_FISSO|nr:hypothetical protein FisN_4Lh361 [Fistulifera solaris]|eukprot:GAX19382.1 hypothetical protein FisN_4Lh361 [Fistulifera solaris]